MIHSRVEEIQRMFEAMGLGRPEDRQRFADFGDAPFEDAREQILVRLENNTLPNDEAQNG